MLATSVVGILLNIVIAWVLAGGGCSMFVEILLGIFFISRKSSSSPKSKARVTSDQDQEKVELKEKASPHPQASEVKSDRGTVYSEEFDTIKRYSEFEYVSDEGSQGTFFISPHTPSSDVFYKPLENSPTHGRCLSGHKKLAWEGTG